MRRPVLIGVAMAGAATVVALVGAGPALAETSDIGRNVGNEVKAWNTSLLLAIAGLLAIPVLAKRDMASGIVLTLLVTLIGGFAFAPGAVRTVIESLWRAAAG